MEEKSLVPKPAAEMDKETDPLPGAMPGMMAKAAGRTKLTRGMRYASDLLEVKLAIKSTVL